MQGCPVLGWDFDLRLVVVVEVLALAVVPAVAVMLVPMQDLLLPEEEKRALEQVLCT